MFRRLLVGWVRVILKVERGWRAGIGVGCWREAGRGFFSFLVLVFVFGIVVGSVGVFIGL